MDHLFIFLLPISQMLMMMMLLMYRISHLTNTRRVYSVKVGLRHTIMRDLRSPLVDVEDELAASIQRTRAAELLAQEKRFV
jgi:hypothetical protein